MPGRQRNPCNRQNGRIGLYRSLDVPFSIEFSETRGDLVFVPNCADADISLRMRSLPS